MPPRNYLRNKKVTPNLQAVPQSPARIPATAKLLDLKEASSALTEQFGEGYSVTSIRKWVRNGDWTEGWHYVRRNKLIKVYLTAVQEWVVSGGH